MSNITASLIGAFFGAACAIVIMIAALVWAVETRRENEDNDNLQHTK